MSVSAKEKIAGSPLTQNKNLQPCGSETFGAGNGDRTRGLLLGKETLYH